MRANRIRARTLAAAVSVVAITVLAFAVASAPAGNRDPNPTLVGFPGPGEVTYLQNVAYTATLPNLQSSTFTKTQFHNPIPTTVSGNQTLKADAQVRKLSWDAHCDRVRVQRDHCPVRADGEGDDRLADTRERELDQLSDLDAGVHDQLVVLDDQGGHGESRLRGDPTRSPRRPSRRRCSSSPTSSRPAAMR